MTSFVLDCSVTMAWCFNDESTPYTRSILKSLETHSAIVPELWNLEVCNVLLMAQNRKRITDNGIFHFLSLLDELPIKTDSAYASIKGTFLLGQRYQLTSYDASYLNLCLNHDIPLATLDKKLEKALIQSGGSVFNPLEWTV